MATWLVGYWPCSKPAWEGFDANTDEIPCFCVFPEGEPDRWIAVTNRDLPIQVQEEAAWIIADALNKLIG